MSSKWFVRELCSKLLAGALSAGVILLWWPTIFPVDTVISWVARGLAWTLLFELLVLAIMPFERSLWGTDRGRRLETKVLAAAKSRISHDDPRRHLGRQGAVAMTALAVPLVALGAGVSNHLPLHTAKAAAPVHVTRVVKVVKRVQVRRVVKREVVTVPPSSSGAPQPSVAAAPVSRPAPAPAPEPKKAPRAKAPQAVTNEPGTYRGSADEPAPCTRDCASPDAQQPPPAS
jgi:hypothetical protein